MKPKLVIIGAGGQGRVVYDAAVKQGNYDILGFVDQSLPVGTVVIGNVKVVASQTSYLENPIRDAKFVIAIGSNSTRKKLFDQLNGKSAAVIIHPGASLGINTVIGNGTVLLAGCVVNTGAQIGENCIVNNLSLVDHDVVIGNNVHIERGSLIGAGCHVKELFTTEMGKAYPPMTEIGA